MYSCPSLPPLRGVAPFPRAPPRSGGGLPVRSRCSLSALLPSAFRAARRYAPRPLLRCPRRYAVAPLLAPRCAAQLCARRWLRLSSVGLFVPAGTPSSSVGLQSFRTAVRFICLSAACLRPYWARPQLRGHSGGVGCPALSLSGVPPSPPRSTPLPLVAPRHGGRGYGSAVVGLRPPLFCRLPRETKMALSRCRSGLRYAPPCVRYASAAPFWFHAPALIKRIFKIRDIVGTFSLLRDRIPTMSGISKIRQQINKCSSPAVAGGYLPPATLPPSVIHGYGLAPKKVPLRAPTPHPPT